MIKKWIKRFVDQYFPNERFGRRSFSQDGEDMLLAAFYETKPNYKGFYVDIGAHHPFRFSNTAHFYQKGWRGINIEPTPSLIPAFKRARKRDLTLNLGVSDQKGSLTFFEFNEPALNSFDETLSLSRENGNYKIIKRSKVAVLPLREILDQHLPEGQKIDFMSIDAEGLDLQILQSNHWEKYAPDYLLVEGAFQCRAIACRSHLRLSTG